MEDYRGSDQFMTPPSELAIAREYMDGITCDPASSIIAAPYVQAKYFAISKEEFVRSEYRQFDTIGNSQLHIDGLSLGWRGNVWLNPPYSKGLIDAYVDMAVEEWDDSARPNELRVERMLILVNSATDTGWYHKLASNATRVFHYRGRLKFWKMVDGQALEKWQGQKNKDDIASGKTDKVKIGNQPRFLNTLFLFERDMSRLDLFRRLYSSRGIIYIPER